MTDTTAGMARIRTLAEKLREALHETQEAPNLDDFTPEERGLARRTFVLYDTDEKLNAAVWFLAIATDPKGRRALEWLLAVALALITVWDGLMVIVRVVMWLRSSLVQIILAISVVALLLFDREKLLEWLTKLGE